MLKKSERLNLFTILFTLYLGLSLIRYIWPAHLTLTFALVIIGSISLILLSNKIPSDNVLIYVFVGLLATAFLVSSLIVHRLDRIAHVMLFIFYNFGVALMLLRGHVRSWGAYFVFYAIAFYFGGMIFTGVDPDNALKHTSHNGISELMIVPAVCLYIIKKNKDEKKIDLKPAFITMLICIWGVGRSGIVASGVLFLGLFWVKKGFDIIIVSLTLFILVALYLIFDQIALLGVNNAYFGRAIQIVLARGMEHGPDVRIHIWSNYFNNLDLYRVLFGANVLTDPWPEGARLAYNYHNMFIHLHLQTGLMALIIYALIFSAMVNFWKSNKVFFVLILTICIRGMTDTFLLFESWDFILYFFIFYFLKNLYIRVSDNFRQAVSRSV